MTFADGMLSLAYWLHMLATVVWLGGLAALAIIVLPALQRSAAAGLEPITLAAILASIQQRLNAVGWFCLILLAATGMIQMSAHPNYEGFLAISNRWAAAILIKHLAFGLMIGLNAYLTWVVLPALGRTALRQKQAPDAAAQRWQNQNALLLRLNLLVALTILGLTALARIS